MLDSKASIDIDTDIDIDINNDIINVGGGKGTENFGFWVLNISPLKIYFYTLDALSNFLIPGLPKALGIPKHVSREGIKQNFQIHHFFMK
jgi:hypothetical protein